LANAESDGELTIEATASDISILMGVCSFIYAKVKESTRRFTGNLVSTGVVGVGTTGTTGLCCSFFLQATKKKEIKKTMPKEWMLNFIVISIILKIKKRHMKISCA